MIKRITKELLIDFGIFEETEIYNKIMDNQDRADRLNELIRQWPLIKNQINNLESYIKGARK